MYFTLIDPSSRSHSRLVALDVQVMGQRIPYSAGGGGNVRQRLGACGNDAAHLSNSPGRIVWCHDHRQIERVNGDAVLPSMALLHCRDEGQRIKEAGQPNDLRQPIVQPAADKVHARVEFRQPGSKRRLGWIRHGLPQIWHLQHVVLQLKVRRVQHKRALHACIGGAT